MHNMLWKRETKSYQLKTEGGLFENGLLLLHRFKDLDCVAALAGCRQTKGSTEEKREGKRERGE